MIVVNGTVSDELKAKLKTGKTDTVAHRFGNLIVAGYCGAVDAKRISFVVTGNESFTYSSTSKAVYFMSDEMINVPKDNILSASCTHFKYGEGNTLSAMNEGEFIFNASTSGGIAIATGNVSFKNTANLTSKDASVAWFKSQVSKGTPVTVTVYLKE